MFVCVYVCMYVCVCVFDRYFSSDQVQTLCCCKIHLQLHAQNDFHDFGLNLGETTDAFLDSTFHSTSSLTLTYFVQGHKGEEK